MDTTTITAISDAVLGHRELIARERARVKDALRRREGARSAAQREHWDALATEARAGMAWHRRRILELMRDPITLPAHARRVALDWASDCTWADIEYPEELDALSDRELFGAITYRYDGGWRGLLADDGCGA